MSHCLTIITGLRGFHHYRKVWKPEIGQEILVKRQPDNPYDKYAVSAHIHLKKTTENQEILIGHLPREISKIVSGLLQKERAVTEATVFDEKERGAPGGKGLELPIRLKLKSNDLKLLKRTEKCLLKKVEVISLL